MSVASQDVYLNLTTPVSVIGGGSSNPNPSFSSISTLALNNISSINGSAYVPGGLPENPVFQSISTLGINNLSSINGVAYVAGVPANLVVSTLVTNLTGFVSTPQVVLGSGMQVYQQNTSTLNLQSPSTIVLNAPNTLATNLTAAGASISTLTVSSFNGARATPFSVGAFNLIISSFSTPQGAGVFPTNAPLVQFSTTVGHSYTVDFGAFITPTQPSVDPATIPTDNEIAFSILCGSDAVEGNSLQTQQVYQIARGLRSTFTINDSITFLAGVGAATLAAGYVSNPSVNFNFTNTTTLSSSSRVIVTDLGVI